MQWGQKSSGSYHAWDANFAEVLVSACHTDLGDATWPAELMSSGWLRADRSLCMLVKQKVEHLEIKHIIF